MHVSTFNVCSVSSYVFYYIPLLQEKSLAPSNFVTITEGIRISEIWITIFLVLLPLIEELADPCSVCFLSEYLT